MPRPQTVGNEKFKVLNRIGEGCFADVYRGVCVETQEDVAIKFEDNTRRSSVGQLKAEVKRIQDLWKHPVKPQGLVELMHYASEPTYDFAVLTLLGKSLEDLLDESKGVFSVQTVALIAEQGLQRIEYLHAKGFLHRDIKPENFMFGLGKKAHHLYIIDFGLSETYYTEVHCPMKTELSLTGNARYASLNAHRGFQQSRRDDLEAFGHMLFQFLLGTLPWSGLPARSTLEKYKKIQEKKESSPIAELCSGFPEEFGTYLSTCRHMDFAERPDYIQLRGLFAKVRREIGDKSGTAVPDHGFDWMRKVETPEDLVTLIVHEYDQPDDYVGFYEIDGIGHMRSSSTKLMEIACAGSGFMHMQPQQEMQRLQVTDGNSSSTQYGYVSPYVTAYAPPAYKLRTADALALEEPFELDAEANNEAPHCPSEKQPFTRTISK